MISFLGFYKINKNIIIAKALHPAVGNREQSLRFLDGMMSLAANQLVSNLYFAFHIHEIMIIDETFQKMGTRKSIGVDVLKKIPRPNLITVLFDLFDQIFSNHGERKYCVFRNNQSENSA